MLSRRIQTFYLHADYEYVSSPTGGTEPTYLLSAETISGVMATPPVCRQLSACLVSLQGTDNGHDSVLSAESVLILH